jgi:predicted nuclease of predicted toxin-antitoxin system
MVKTPAQDYDDSYCISYARQANAFIVTNDKFRDYLRKIEVNPSMND